MKRYLIGLLLISCSSISVASDYLLIPDMSQLKFQISGTKVYLRNLNQFDESWADCCYSYYVDLTTDDGRATWSTMLAKMTVGGRYYIGVNSKSSTPSAVSFSGDW